MKKYYGFILAFLIGIMMYSMSVYAYDYQIIETKWITPNFQDVDGSSMLTEVYEGSVSENGVGQLYQIEVPKAGYVKANWKVKKRHEDNAIEGILMTRLYNKDKEAFEDYSQIEGDSCSKFTTFSGYNLDVGTYYIEARWCEEKVEDTEDYGTKIIRTYQDPDVEYSVYFEFRQKDGCTFDNEVLTKKVQKKSDPIPFATRIKGFKPLSISNDVMKDGHFYKIVIPKDGKIQICAKVPLQMRVWLEGKNGGNVLFKDENEKDDYYNVMPDAIDDDIESTLFLKKGTYYLFMGHATGDYEFELRYEKDALETFRVSAKSDTQFRVTAEKAGGIAGYQIRYKYGNKKWKKKTIQTGQKLDRTIRKCRKGETYSVQLRTYYLNDGKKLFSRWSDTKTVKL